ncbi:MAG: DUF523 domain-containing protein [Myxococcales bacterium]|nr:DUF523 domain-containing protein [Myxococcales bacterium]
MCLVSACLLGQACRYDGGSKPDAAVAQRAAQLRQAGLTITLVCPEELGGLGTPRPAAELRGGDGAAIWRGEAAVQRVGDDGDVTAAFIRGAELALGGRSVSSAILKARSPSCGAGRTHIDGQVRDGDGVFAALLRKNGVTIVTEDDL